MNPDEILEKAKQLRAAGVPLEEIERYIQSKLGGATTPAQAKIREEHQKGLLEPRLRRLNENEADELDDEPEGFARATGTVASLARDIPGAEALQAGARSVVRRQPYREALKDIRGGEESAPAYTRIPARIAGGAISAFAIPGSPAMQGARFGVAEGMLQADPDADVRERVHDAATGAITGAIAGRVSEHVGTGARALFTKSPAKALLAKQAERAKSARELYDAAQREGQAAGMGVGKRFPGPVQQFLAEPDIAEIVTELKATRPFQNVAADSPEMLDAVYKTLSDRAGTLKRGLESVTPNRPNIGRFRMADTRQAQEELLKATDPVMPSYRKAVDDFASRSQEIDAMRKGFDALRTSTSGSLPSSKSLTRSTPEALEESLPNDPVLARAAGQGVLGAAKMATAKHPIREAMGFFPSVRAASPMLRNTDDVGNKSLVRLLRGASIPALSPSPEWY